MNSLHKKIEHVCEYIEHNLDSPLNLELLSEVACYSKFHFHRVFKAITGLSVQQYVLYLRLRRASFRISFEKNVNLSDIGYEAGFDSPEAFSRAFKREVGQLPSEFRQNADWENWNLRLKKKQARFQKRHNMKIEVVEFPEIQIAYLSHIGSPDSVLKTAGKFIEWRKETGLSPVKTSRTFGIAYSDPETTPPDEFRWDVCGSVKSPVPENSFGVKNGILPAGKCAVIRHQGSHEGLSITIWDAIKNWLPESQEELRDHPIYFEYLNFIFEVDECDLLTDIYLPLK